MIAILRQFIVFCGVGLINTIVGLAVILILSEILGVNYLLSNLLGYAVGLCIGFWLHRSITFRSVSDEGKVGKQAQGFLGVFAVAYLTQFLFLMCMTGALNVPNIIAQTLACGLYMVISYTGNRLLTFKASH